MSCVNVPVMATIRIRLAQLVRPALVSSIVQAALYIFAPMQNLPDLDKAVKLLAKTLKVKVVAAVPRKEELLRLYAP